MRTPIGRSVFDDLYQTLKLSESEKVERWITIVKAFEITRLPIWHKLRLQSRRILHLVVWDEVEYQAYLQLAGIVRDHRIFAHQVPFDRRLAVHDVEHLLEGRILNPSKIFKYATYGIRGDFQK